MNRRAIQPHPAPSQPADVSKLTLILEYDGASRTTYVRGKDGRLYREADVAATEARAERGDAVARAALIVVDFAVDDQGVPRTEDDTFAAMIANREVWERGEFDHLVQIAELFAPAGRPPLTWAQTRRIRREYLAERRRERGANASLLPMTPERAAKVAAERNARPGGSYASRITVLPSAEESAAFFAGLGIDPNAV